MLPGESATTASKIDPKNIRNDAKVNKHEEQKKKPDINNDKDDSKDETKSTSYSASTKNKYNACYNAIVVDNEGKVHKITLDNIPELKQLVKDDDTLKRLINWLM